MSLEKPIRSRVKDRYRKENNISKDVPIYSFGDLGADLGVKKKILIEGVKRNKPELIKKYNLIEYENDIFCLDAISYETLFKMLRDNLLSIINSDSVSIDITENFTATQLSTRYGIDKLAIGKITKELGLKTDEYAITRTEISYRSNRLYERTYYNKKALEVLDKKLLNLSVDEKNTINQMYGKW